MSVTSFAPSNIALIKYWGKRDSVLNLPVTSSLSLSLPVGTKTTLAFREQEDLVSLNGTTLAAHDPFTERLVRFCNCFRPKGTFFQIDTVNEIPTGAGLASSASGFAALVLAMNQLLKWNKEPKELSIIARQASGSACRSIFRGLVEWHRGIRADGLDSYAEPLDIVWPELKIGLWILSDKQKPIDSRNAMNATVETSPLYKAWPGIVTADLARIKQAIISQNFSAVGEVAEHNALSMHATMMAATPSILYWLPESVQAINQVWQWRKEGIEVYFTMDAGPNLKLLYLEKTKEKLKTAAATTPIVLFD